MVSKILLLILTVFSFQAYSRTVFDDTVKSVSRISDDYAVDRVEYFVWGLVFLVAYWMQENYKCNKVK